MIYGIHFELCILCVFTIQSVTLPELPSVVVFKDGAYFTYDGKYLVGATGLGWWVKHLSNILFALSK